MTQDKNNPKLKMHSPDLTQDNIAKLAELFPNCVTESRDEQGQIKQSIDFDQLRQELSGNIVEGPQERYHINWPGKREALLNANAPVAKTMRPYRDESVDFDTTKNLFIEGDNLESLKLLQETYLGKVKMIYIDPPYNTGKDFIYADDFAESAYEFLQKSNQKDKEGNRLVTNINSNGRFHSDWLCMMYPRLKLARNFLKDDGVIFISIDDNESHNLRRICDEIFGEKNFIATFVWNGKSGSEDDKDIRNNHEYALAYCKSSNNYVAGLNIKDEEEKFPLFDPQKQDYYKRQLLRKWGDNSKREDRPKLYYSITMPDGTEFFPKLPDGSDGCWRWGREKMQEAIDKGYIEFDTTRNGRIEAYEKIYKSDITRKTKKFQSLLLDAGSTSGGTKELNALLDNNKLFDRPKPINYLRILTLIANTSKKDLVLDFFAGSASFAHAVMKLNSEDGGNRQFIMIQLPEPCEEKTESYKAGYKTIAEIGKERIRRAGEKILEGKCHEDWNKDIGFRVLKVDTSNMKDVYYTPDKVTQRNLFGQIDNIKENRTDEDLLFQVLVDWGVDLTLPIHSEVILNKTVYFVDQDALAACFEADIDREFVKKLAEKKPLRVVFRDTGFSSDSTKINVEQIFKLISPTTEVKTI